MKEVYKEEDFYKDGGWPTESFRYCSYIFYTEEINEFGRDYDQFALVSNAEYPYIRLTKKRGRAHFPCGGRCQPATDGSFARLSENERDELCPKIARGFAAEFLSHLNYDEKQKDYVETQKLDAVICEYYDKYLKIYLENHSGLKYSKLSFVQKELDFIVKHEVIIRGLWEKSTLLSNYPILFEYAKMAETNYERYLSYRKNEMLQQMNEKGHKIIERYTNVQDSNELIYKGTVDMNKRKGVFSTEIREVFGKPYIKIYFLDDSVTIDAKDVIYKLNVVRTVNITTSISKDHPGKTLTVYPKSMVSVEDCENDIINALNGFFTQGILADKKPIRNDAYFNGIADKIIKDLDNARVSIYVCVAWFTNQIIADKLVEKYNQGIDVKVIYYNDHTNSKFGVNIDKIPFKAVRGSRGGTMHNKYCIIDNQIVITGSYNWSENAEKKNDENAAVMYDYDRASDYTVEFRKMFGS